MEETLITFPTAKLAKDRKFKEKTICYFLPHARTPSRGDIESTSLTPGIYPAPTQGLLQKWLREKHNIEVYVIPLETILIDKRHYQLRILSNTCLRIATVYDSYEEALEQGLQQALELIPNKE